MFRVPKIYCLGLLVVLFMTLVQEIIAEEDSRSREDYDDCDELISRLQNNYQDGFAQIIEEFNSVKSNLSQQNIKLERVKDLVSQKLKEVEDLESQKLKEVEDLESQKLKEVDQLLNSTLSQQSQRLEIVELLLNSRPTKVQDLIPQMVNFPHAELHSEENFTGDLEKYRFDTSTFEGGYHQLGNLKQKVKSVRTFGKCVRLFYGSYCNGWSLAVYPGSGNSQTVLNSNLKEVQSIGPCLSEEFQNAYLKGTGNLDVVKDARDAHKYFPDLIELYSLEKSSRSKNASATNSSITHYTQGPSNRLEFIRAEVFKRHLTVSQPNFNVENSEFYRSLDKRPGDVAGFAIAPSIGGPKNESYNVFPQTTAARKELTNLARKIEIQMGTDPPRSTVFALNLIYDDNLASRPYVIYYFINYSDKRIEYGRILN